MDAFDPREPSVSGWLGGRATVVVAWVRALPRRERDAWALVLAVFAADVVLTYVGLRLGLSEGNPLMAYAIGVGGILALALAKTIVLVVAALVRLRRPEDGTAIALGVAIPWLLAVLLNAVSIA